MICPVCERDFPTTRLNKFYCSEACQKNRNWRSVANLQRLKHYMRWKRAHQLRTTRKSFQGRERLMTDMAARAMDNEHSRYNANRYGVTR